MNTENEKTEEEIIEFVADGLTALGFAASSQDTVAESAVSFWNARTAATSFGVPQTSTGVLP